MRAEVAAVIRKEFRQISRDKRLMPLLFIAPAMQLLVFGFAADFNVEEVKTAWCDMDSSSYSRDFLSGMLAGDAFVPVGPVSDCGHPEEMIRRRSAEAVVVIPAGFARDIVSGRTASVQFLVDGSNPTIGRFADNATRAYASSRAYEISSARASRAAAAAGVDSGFRSPAIEMRVFYNPTMESAIFMVPGVAAMVLLVVTMIATAMGLAREREMGTLEQVMVTPIRPGALIIGKTLPFVLIGFVDILLVSALAVWVFDVPVRGSALLAAGGTLLFIMSTVGLGLFVSTVSRNQQQAFIASFFIMMPAVLLSGVLTPVFNMPDWLKPLAYMNPIKYYVDILRAVLLKDAGFVDVAPSMGALAAFGSGILTLAVLRFGKKIG